MLKRFLVFASGVMSFAGLYAANYYFIGNSTDSLQDVGNYRMNGRTGEAATQLPDTGDCIYFNNKYDTLRTYELSAADTAFVAGRGLRALKVQDAVVTFNVDTDLEFSCAINGSDATDAFRRTGKIIKKGEGKMTLSSYGAFTKTGATDDYMMKEIEVAEGTLLLPQAPASGAKSIYTAILNVAEGASLLLPASYVTTVYCDGLQGAGSVVYGGTGNIGIYVSKHAGTALDFSGTVTGNIYCKVNDGAQQTFSGVKNDFTRGIDVGAGAVLGFSTGNTAKDGEQSLGTYGDAFFDSETSTLKYVGQGQQTYSKVIRAKYGMTYDGGPYGGLVLGTSGYPWRLASANNNPGVARLILQGDGLAENEMRCHVFNKYEDDIMSVPLTLVKRGAGTWRLFGSSNYEIDSTVAVDEGTLRFNSLTAAGTRCSLGWGTHLYDPDYSVAGEIDETKKVGYHIRLGGGTTAGVLEYVGTDEVDNDTRVIAVNGAGTLRNASEAAFTHRGVITVSEGEHVLTLDRTATSGDFTVGDITNSLGTLSVVKTGSGDVHLDGRLDFNGDLSVREGRLVAGNTVYTYFRFTVKDNMADEISKANFNHVLRLTEFALYDADGNRLNTGLTQKPADAASLGEGQFRYVRGRNYNTTDTDVPANLFDDSASTHWVGIGGYSKFDPADSSKDFIMEMRLPADSPRAVSFDYITDYNGTTEKGVVVEGTDYGWYVAAPRVYVLEGSVDGENWETLYSESDAFTGMLLRSKKWASSGGTEAFEAEAVRKVSEGKGFAFKSSSEKLFETLSNIKTVSVASSATLDLRGNVAPIKGLVIDASTGIGEVIGGTLADTGTVTLVNVGEGQEFVPGSLKGIEGYLKLADRNAWTFVVKGTDGEVIPHRTVSLNADGFLLVRGPGLRLTVR